MQLNHLSPDAGCGFDLFHVRCDKDRHAAAGLPQGGDEMGQFVFLTRHFKATLGGAFLTLFRHDADGMRFVTQRDLLHFVRRGHLKVQRHRQDLHQPIDVSIGDVTTVFAQVGGDAIGTGLFCKLCRAQRIRIGPATGVSHCGHMVNIHAETQFSQRLHRLLLRNRLPRRGPT